jgi:response regulator RpfG family c-di-GMP phosphodiesterase
MLVNNTNTNSNYNNSTNSYSILLIDDEVDTLSVIKRPLQEYGFDICSFTKPAIALEHYKTNSNTQNNSLSTKLLVDEFPILTTICRIDFGRST